MKRVVADTKKDGFKRLKTADVTADATADVTADVYRGYRGQLLQWVFEIVKESNIHDRVMFAAIDMFDNYGVVDKGQVQLLGISCLWLATKLCGDELCGDDANYACDGAYTLEKIQQMQRSILLRLFPNFSLDDYVEKHMVGEGTFGKVFCVESKKEDRKKYDEYVYKRAELDEEKTIMRDTFRECTILKRLNHRHILSLCGVQQTDAYVYFLFPRMQCDLSKKISSNTLTTEKKLYYFAQIVSGLKYCHERHIAHRDLTPQNILIGDDDVVKICDFGQSTVYVPDCTLTCEYCTLWYRPVEMLLGATYDMSVDIWSVGCIFYELITQHPLFSGETNTDQLNIIFESMGTPVDNIWPSMAEKLKTFRTTFPTETTDKDYCFFDPDEYGECIVRMNPFMNTMVEYDPKKRLSCSDILEQVKVWMDEFKHHKGDSGMTSPCSRDVVVPSFASESGCERLYEALFRMEHDKYTSAKGNDTRPSVVLTLTLFSAYYNYEELVAWNVLGFCLHIGDCLRRFQTKWGQQKLYQMFAEFKGVKDLAGTLLAFHNNTILRNRGAIQNSLTKEICEFCPGFSWETIKKK